MVLAAVWVSLLLWGACAVALSRWVVGRGEAVTDRGQVGQAEAAGGYATGRFEF